MKQLLQKLFQRQPVPFEGLSQINKHWVQYHFGDSFGKANSDHVRHQLMERFDAQLNDQTDDFIKNNAKLSEQLADLQERSEKHRFTEPDHVYAMRETVKAIIIHRFSKYIEMNSSRYPQYFLPDRSSLDQRMHRLDHAISHYLNRPALYSLDLGTLLLKEAYEPCYQEILLKKMNHESRSYLLLGIPFALGGLLIGWWLLNRSNYWIASIVVLVSAWVTRWAFRNRATRKKLKNTQLKAWQIFWSMLDTVDRLTAGKQTGDTVVTSPTYWIGRMEELLGIEVWTERRMLIEHVFSLANKKAHLKT